MFASRKNQLFIAFLVLAACATELVFVEGAASGGRSGHVVDLVNSDLFGLPGARVSDRQAALLVGGAEAECGDWESESEGCALDTPFFGPECPEDFTHYFLDDEWHAWPSYYYVKSNGTRECDAGLEETADCAEALTNSLIGCVIDDGM